jgi:hypothetical protein
MTLLIVGEASTAEALARAENRPETPARVWSAERGGDAGPRSSDAGPRSSAPLARALVAFEAEVESARPDAIVLADDSDAALAAALVGAKLLIEVGATADATRPASSNGRLIAQLAGTYTPAA